MRGRRNSIAIALGAALFGCAAAPMIADLPAAGTETADPPAAARSALDGHMARFAAGRFVVGKARYVVPQAGLGWQPLLSQVATDPKVQRGATRLVMPSDRPEDWLVEVWRTKGRDGFAVALLGGSSERLLGYYSIEFVPGFKGEARAAGKPG